MTISAYEQLRKRLDQPTLTVISDWPEFVHPHQPPEPAPVDGNGRESDRVRQLMADWSLSARIVAAALAHRLVRSPREPDPRDATDAADVPEPPPWELLLTGAPEEHIGRALATALAQLPQRLLDNARRRFVERWWARLTSHLAVARLDRVQVDDTLPAESDLPRLLVLLRRDAEHARGPALAISTLPLGATLKPLLAMLFAEAEQDRAAAAFALGSFGHVEESARAGIVRSLAARAVDPQHRVRAVLAESLGRLGDPIAAPTLLRLMHDSDPAVATTATLALASVGDASLIDALLPAVEQATSNRAFDVASRALVRLLERSGIPQLGSALGHPTPRVRRVVLEELARRAGSSEALRLLTIAAGDRDRTVRQTAVHAVARFEHAERNEALRTLAHDDRYHPDVARLATDYLRQGTGAAHSS